MKPKLSLLCLLVGCLFTNSLEAQSLNALLQKADSLRKLDNYNSAELAYKEALKNAILQRKQDTTAIIYLRLGVVFERRSIYTEALNYYFKSLRAFEIIDSKSKVAAVKKNIGNVYRTVGKLEDAFSYVNSAYLELSELHDSLNLPYAINDLGNISMDQDSTDKALAYFIVILREYNHYTDKQLKASAITNVASIYLIKENYSQALRFYRKAYDIRKGSGDKYKMASILCNMTIAFIEMKEFDEALKAQTESLKLAKEVGAKQIVQWGYDNYSEIYRRKGDYKDAYTAAVQGIAWRDSVNSQISKEYKLSEANYQREKEEIENKLLREETRLKNRENEDNKRSIQQARWILLIVIIIASLIIISLFLLYKTYKTKQKSHRILENQRSIVLESQLKESELTALRAQMNPHFIFNALSSIKNYMLEQNTHLADYYLGKFAKLIRLILDNSSQNFVSLEKELQLLESYIQLEALRFENKFSYVINVQEEINTMETFIPSMIIQPFVENAIIHGFMHKEGKCHLQIDIKYYTSFIMVTITDDGIGRIQSAEIKSNSGNTLHESKGYKISEQRLKVLSKGTNSNTGIVFKDLGNHEGKTGTMVEISIPLESSSIIK